ncbi:hypothetical protein D6792_03515 [Candidatus Parcubacteria bacterium]|nr:MAG: hypothetical protein D6792_03515 [Candidatus Parcubacteria bacterium]
MECEGTFSLRSNSSGRITADKRQNLILLKLPLATFFYPQNIIRIIFKSEPTRKAGEQKMPNFIF